MRMLSKSPRALHLAIAFPFRAASGFPHHHRSRIRRRCGLRDPRRSNFALSGGSGGGGGSGSLPPLGDESHRPAVLPSDPVGVVFDMDGTLIKHSIDFADMRRRVYAIADADPVGRTLERDDVLALAARLSPEGRERCDVVFSDVERRAREDMELKEGGTELVEFLGERGIRRAVLTRNLERNVAVVRDTYRDAMGGCEGPIFDPIVARDTLSVNGEPLRAKPRPDGILHICDLWGCDPSEVIMVGDSANDDVAAANRAGCGGAVLLTQPGGQELDTDSGYATGDSEEERRERTPSLRVESLGQLRDCLEALLEGRRDVPTIECDEGVQKDTEEVRSTTFAA